MKLLLVPTLLLVLSGCTAVNYYAPDSGGNLYRGGGACSTTVAYEAPIASGIQLFVRAEPLDVTTAITVVFRVPQGQAIQLLSSSFAAEPELSPSVLMNASFITTGSSSLRVPMTKFAPGELLVADGRYSQLPEPYGPDARFITDLTLPGRPPPRFTLRLPPMRINGNPIEVAPIQFVLSSEIRALCLQ